MPFADLETSLNQSNKILLFDFQVGVTPYRYTNASSDFTLSLNVYKAIPISINEITSSDDINKKTVNVTMLQGEAFTLNGITARTTSTTTVTITEVQLDDNSSNIIFTGRVLSYKFKNADVILPCESIYTSILRVGIKRDYGPNCDHELYDSNTCRVLASAFITTGTISVVSGAVLTIPAAGALASGWFTGGYMTFPVVDDLDNSLMIVDHSGTSITVEYVNSLVTAGLSVDMYPGCDRTGNTCATKFNNIINNGAFLFHPDKNPFGGTKVF